MQKMLKALEESDRHLVELEERRLEYEERQLERVAAKKRREGIPAATAAISGWSCRCTRTYSCC